ncbi:hypothetical protein BDW42DRAFT_162358 [Aspergillus taichungensis]|uniref:Uncharacterized protein n=1 Tax=Aspergillus taichungensis TaxID=482145 RepID=A0A2J5I401_9EURO|nr:hypothetical protein BDW42DRAFT_162358 [Aspergillus taichungensis]
MDGNDTVRVSRIHRVSTVDINDTVSQRSHGLYCGWVAMDILFFDCLLIIHLSNAR